MPGQFHGPRNLGGYHPWGHKELDTSVPYFLISLRKKDLVDEERKAFKFKKAAVMNSVSFPGGANGKKNPTANTGDIRDTNFIPGSRRSPGEGHSNPLQYFCLENPMDRRARQATVYGVTKGWT